MNLTTSPPTSFKTERLLIRRYREEDVDLLYAAARASITRVFEFLPWCHPDYQRQDAIDWLGAVTENWKKADTWSFGIFSADGQQLHGGCGISRIDEHPIGNLGYWIGTGSEQRGIATEATIALAEYGLRELGLQRIEIIMSVRNEGSRKVAIAAGASFEGQLRNRLLLHGARHDAYQYSIIPEDLGLSP